MRAFRITSGQHQGPKGPAAHHIQAHPRPEPGSVQCGHARDPAQPRPGEPGDGHRRVPDWRDDALFSLDLEGHLIGSQIDAQGDSTAAPLTRNSALVGAVPTITKERGAYKVRVGAGLWVDARGRQAFHFYPTAEVRFRLLDDVFVPYGGVDGGMQRNALHDLVQENPWFDARYNAGADALRGTLQNTNRALEVYGGLRGKFTRDLAFNAQARTVTYRDFGYWVNEPGLDSTSQRFSLAFDTLTVASVIGEAAYRGQGPLELEARAEFHTYGTGNQPHAWYQPRTRISGSARWNLDELLFLEVGMDIVGARYAPSRTPCSRFRRRGRRSDCRRIADRPRVRRDRSGLRAETAGLHSPGHRRGIPLQRQAGLGFGRIRPAREDPDFQRVQRPAVPGHDVGGISLLSRRPQNGGQTAQKC